MDTPQTPIVRILTPFQQFFRNEAMGGILLLAFTGIALIWANSPLAESYNTFWHTHLVIGAGDFKLDKSLLHWVNDGLMVIFFFVVGLEIKREVLIGELASRRKAALPIAAALGGMLAPAALFLLVNAGGAAQNGWGVPMATDIAFALGVLSLLGNRVPISLKVFLTALAIVDDIGAILVIALFYTAEISSTALVAGAVFLGLLILANRLGVRHPLIYGLLSLGLWVAFLKSGVHATVAGVLAAMTIPARTLINADEFIKQAHFLIHEFECGECGEYVLPNKQQRAALQALEGTIQNVESPMQRLEHALHPWMSFGIMPIFALANAGVALGGDLGATFTQPLAIGVILGLVIGKPLGVTLASWLAVRLGLADLPNGVTWRQIAGAGMLAGIGFTMALFIGSLAFEGSPLLDATKIGILAASLVAGVLGWLALRATGSNENGLTS
ncbi:MAG: Na+/H+ antiporter NhaA [Anaerolineae bacterium]|nr:Na+/H+ antiporter NhaA [Anaerolineae bacterium]